MLRGHIGVKRIGRKNIVRDYVSAESFCREFFSFDSFTELQETVLKSPLFWNQCQNLIIKGAPGSGKTLLTELALFSLPERENRAKKLLYLLPYRALLNEKYNYFRRRYDLSCYRIYRSSSDYNDNDEKIISADCEIAVMIYEKLDNALHAKSMNDCIFYKYDLIVMDEFSLTTTLDRGIIINDILRIYNILPTERDGKRKARMIALTVPDCTTSEYVAYGFEAISSKEKATDLFEAIIRADVGRVIPKVREENWPISYENLEVAARIDKERGLKQALRDEFDLMEPCEHYEHKELLLYIIKAHRQLNHNIIVFCSSRETTYNLCKSISKMVHENHIRHSDWSERLSSIQHNMGDNSYGCIDYTMLTSARYGVTFHNADLSSELRLEIEQEFSKKKDSRLNIVVSTETLAYGINCSADVVIIYDRIKPTSIEDYPNFQYGHNRYMRYLNHIEYNNYVGRAGRLGYGSEQTRHVGYAYLFAKDGPGEKSVRAWYYSNHIKSPTSCKRLFLSKLKRSRLATTSIVFNALTLNSVSAFNRDDLIDALHYLSGKDSLPHEDETASALIKEMQKLQLIEPEDRTEIAFTLTRLGESLYGMQIPYEILRTFKDISQDLRKNGFSFFPLLYQLCGAACIRDLCSINRKAVRLKEISNSIFAFLDQLEVQNKVSSRNIKKLRKSATRIYRAVEQLQPNNEGYAYIDRELADSLHQYFNAAILYLWAEGYSLESINKNYKLPAKMGAINNFSRNIIFVLDSLIKYLSSFSDTLPLSQEVMKAKQAIKYGMPYCCVEALNGRIALAIRPEVCATYAKAGEEICCSILQKAASQIDDCSSPTDIKKLRNYLKLKLEELENEQKN